MIKKMARFVKNYLTQKME